MPAHVTILIADDHPVIRNALRFIITINYPFAILHEVGTADAVLDITKTLHFDLVICDLHMPGTQGFDVLRKLKLQNPVTRVILISASSEMMYALQAREEGAVAYIDKQNLYDNLLPAVEQALAI